MYAPGLVSPDEAGVSGGAHGAHVAELPQLDHSWIWGCALSYQRQAEAKSGWTVDLRNTWKMPEIREFL